MRRDGVRRATFFVLAAVLAGGSTLLTAGCSKEPPPPAPSTGSGQAPPPSAPAPPPAPPLPPLGGAGFRDWAEIDEEKFLELPPATEPPVLKWDFGPGRRYGYDLSQTLSQAGEHVAGAERNRVSTREKNRGVFEFVAGKDRTAYAAAKIQSEEMFLNDQPVPRDVLQKTQPTIVKCVISEEGVVDGKDDRARFYFQTFLALEPGEHAAPLGWIRTRPAGFFKVERHACVRLETEFEFASEDAAQRNLMRGRVVSYFSIAERKFIRASGTVATSARSHGHPKDKPDVWVTSSIDAVTRYRLKLLD